MPIALKRANEWKKDAVLTSIQLISEGKEEIENRNGGLNYTFEFEYVNETKPGGILFVSISTRSNSIEFVSGSHDGEDKWIKVDELEMKEMAQRINKIYDIIVFLGGKNQYQQMHFIKHYSQIITINSVILQEVKYVKENNFIIYYFNFIYCINMAYIKPIIYEG